jgi:DNA-binding transcriptional MerR regulator
MNTIKKSSLKNSFSSKQASEFSELSMAMVNYLFRTGLMVPAIGRKRGKGIERKYSFGDLVILKSIAKLLDAGVSVLRLKKALVNLRKLHADITLDNIPGAYLVTDGKDVYLKQSNGVLELLVNGQMGFVFVVDIESVRKDAVSYINRIYIEKDNMVVEKNVA